MATDAQRAAINDALATLDRVSSISYRNDTAHEAPEPNALDRWRKEVLEDEAKRAAARSRREAQERAENGNSMVWQSWVAGQVRDAVCTAAVEIGTEMTARFNALMAGFDKRDERVRKLESELARLEVDFRKAEVARLRDLVDSDKARVIDMPSPLSARSRNIQ